MSNSIALSFQNVTKKFGGLTAVDKVNFDIHDNEVFGLIGPNGSGKTTVLDLVSGLLRLSSGKIISYDKKISGKTSAQIARRGVSRTFQLVRMLPTLSVKENIASGGVFGFRRYRRKELDRKVNYMMSQVGLTGKGMLPVTMLTYIDQKRVELARALMSDPKIILLDEWLAGLNPTEMKIGINLISGIRYEGRTVVVVEHHMEAIRSLCDRCIVMNSGQTIAEGKPNEVLNDEQVIAAYLGVDNA